MADDQTHNVGKRANAPSPGVLGFCATLACWSWPAATKKIFEGRLTVPSLAIRGESVWLDPMFHAWANNFGEIVRPTRKTQFSTVRMLSPN